MLKYFFSFLIFLSACSQESIVTLPENLESDSGMYIFEAPHGFEMIYDSGADSSMQKYYQSGTIVLNGSYFGRTKDGVEYPAGLWRENTKNLFPPDFTDPNLSYVVAFSGVHMQILPVSLLQKDTLQSYSHAFQAGPLVLSGGILQNVGTSWHANGPHERTLIGLTKSGRIYFFIFSRPITLAEVGEIVRKDSRFLTDPLTLLNLDGGPSTAFFDGKDTFRENKKLPIIIRIY